MSFEAKIILDSISPIEGARLTTFELTYPRFIHAELLTHKALSRNSASSRAIPTEKLLQRIVDDPAMPVHWGANQSGMQAKEELSDEGIIDVTDEWLRLRSTAVTSARRMNALGLHKQIANRVVEPWMSITVLVTATELSNMRGLRVDPNAQPEFERIARMAFDLYDASKPQLLAPGAWHLPLVTGNDEPLLRAQGFDETQLCFISVGRCARVSYLTHNGRRDPIADTELAMKLGDNGHMSPFEHVAQAMTSVTWAEWANEQARAWIEHRIPMGNFWGWKQLRKTIPNEHDFSIIKSMR